MKAIVYHSFGSPDVLKHEEIERPTAGDNEVLIRVRAVSINPLDWRLMRGGPYVVRVLMGLRTPTVTRPGRPGHDVAGVVEAAGRNVSQFKPGDEVFGTCDGSLAEYACASAAKLARKPDKVTFEQAASVPIAALTALQGFRDRGHIQRGQQVLINGAAGGVGTFAVQIAKWFGANVTGVCSTRNAEMVRSIGADRVIDYTREDFTAGLQRYDLILDCVGNRTLSACRRVLNHNGKLLIAGGPKEIAVVLTRALKAALLSRFVSQSLSMFVARINPKDLTVLGELIAAGKVMPVIDRRYPLSEAPEAIRYLEQGHARGKVVISVP